MIARGAALVVAMLWTPIACAHGFGQRYDLPIPLSLYLAGAATTVAISCVMLALFMRAEPQAIADDRSRGPRPLAGTATITITLQWSVVALFLLVIAAGLVGNENPLKNLAPVAIWAIWWVGFGYLSALVGDVWRVVNPLDTLYRALETAWPAARRPAFRLPPWVGTWPCVALFAAWFWMEIAWPASDQPASLAAAVLAYSLATWTGMFLFGREAWLHAGEVFGAVFGILARFAALELELHDGRVVAVRWRPYGEGLLARAPASLAQIALVILMLAAVSFDGFLETPAWAAWMQAWDGADPVVARTFGLLVAPVLFFAVYAAACRLIVWAGGERVETRRMMGLFAWTLVPIAIAYQLAHYFSFLLMAGQYLIPLASDPFGFGWDLFGGATYFIRPALVDARFVWYLSVTVIVAGHVAALYLSHRLSLREFPDRRDAVRSQWPMLALMVSYTMLSLWIIAQPIVSSRFA